MIDDLSAQDRFAPWDGADAPGAIRDPWPDPSGEITPRMIVAVPMKDEAAYVEPCLKALISQTTVVPDEILVLVNNSSDRCAAIAARVAMSSPVPILIDTVELPRDEAHAGGARRRAMRWAAERAGDNGILLTTDADGVVCPTWVEVNLAAIKAGAEAVAGRARLDPADEARLPPSLIAADALECEYAALLDEIDARLDPIAWDPWPRHDEHSGASIAVTAAAYLRAGGMPRVESGEDREFFNALRRVDARVHHARDAVVTVSGRVEGRAAGGMADTIRRRLVCADAFLDSRLEPAREAIARSTFRHRLRMLWSEPTGASARDINRLAGALDVSSGLVRRGIASRYFGAAWTRLEARSPRLRRRLVPVTAVHEQIRVARSFLAVLDGETGSAVQAYPGSNEA
jgi:hypothetical protein